MDIYAQQQDSLISPGDTLIKLSSDKEPIKHTENKKIGTSLIVPAVLFTYGIISLESDALQSLDNKIKEEIWTENPHRKVSIDNYLQYAPAIMVYGLNALGIHGKNNFRDRSYIYLLANTMMGVTVQSLKAITKIQRPDGAGTNAFPSGHTATAFVGAEFLRQEYKDISPWYGIAGYTVAITTAYLRMYNNKHWFRDLLPGAGIGMAATKLAYWIYPSIKRTLFKNKPMNNIIVPYYQSGVGGFSMLHTFQKHTILKSFSLGSF